MHQLIIFRGLPVSGKTALAKSLKGFLHIESAMFKGHGPVPMAEIIRAEATCLGAVRAALKDNQSVVVSNCFSKVEYMLPFMRAAIDAGAEVRIFEAHKTFRGDLKFTADEMDGYRRAHEAITLKTVAGTLDHAEKERQRALKKFEILGQQDAVCAKNPYEATNFAIQSVAAENVVSKLVDEAVAAGGKVIGDDIVFEFPEQFEAFAKNAVVTEASNGQG